MPQICPIQKDSNDSIQEMNLVNIFSKCSENNLLSFNDEKNKNILNPPQVLLNVSKSIIDPAFHNKDPNKSVQDQIDSDNMSHSRFSLRANDQNLNNHPAILNNEINLNKKQGDKDGRSKKKAKVNLPRKIRGKI